jgi:L-lactate dehydrogenase (cytochrome)
MLQLTRDPIRSCRNIADLRELARRRVPAPMFHYIDGAAEDEWTLRESTGAFDRWMLMPRTLVDVSALDTSVEVLGQRIALPFFCAPTGMSRLFHHEGELAVARAARAAGTMYSLSTMGSRSIEDVAAVSDGPKMYQIYVFKDRELCREFIARCKASGYHALCLTVDVPVPGNRERDLRTGMTIPPSITLRSAFNVARHPRWLWHYLTTPRLQLANVVHRISDGSRDVSTLASYIHRQFDRTVTWDDAAWMAREWGGPFLVKGVLTAEDARRAVAAGATAIAVSNHGGRQLDSTPAPVEVLSEIVDAVGDRAEVILDGGVRRGVHVLKALALGAKACMIGRAYLYGLGAGGEPGVARAIEILRTELERDMALLGVRRVSEITPEHIRRVPA